MEADTRNVHENGVESDAERDPPMAVSAAPIQAGLKLSRRRLLGVNALISVTTVLLIVGMFAVWTNRLLFSPGNWSKTSTQLLQNPDIRSATANYLIDQLYTKVNVAGLIGSGLPKQLRPLAAPAAGALRDPAVQGVELALLRPRIQGLWERANRAADQTFIAVVDGGKGSVAVNQGAVTLNLGLILDNVASRLGLPAGLSAKLPPNAANLTVFRSDQLKLVQDGGNAIRGLALWLTILVPLLYALAVVLSPGRRRRTLMTIGFAGVFAGALVLLGRSILETQITNSLTSDASLRPAIRATIAISTAILSGIAGAVIAGGIVLIAAAWFGGPTRVARTAREGIAPFLREHPVGSYAAALAVMLLVFIWDPIPATGTPAGIIVFTLLALLGTEALIRQTVREFPGARAGGAGHAIRAGWESMRGKARDREVATAPAAPSTAEQLTQLAELREHGAITSDEYEAAKRQVLHR